MFIATRVVSTILDPAVILGIEGYDWVGPVAELKKGRDTTAAAAKGQLALGSQASGIATADQGLQSGYRNASDTAANNLLTVPTNGGLNPALSRAFEQEKTQIGKTYGDTAQAGLRGIAARGMGVTPTGLDASVTNTAARNADEATTNAYGNLLGQQLGLGVQGIQRQDQQQQVYDPTKPIDAATGAYGGASQTGAIQAKQGSTLGDIASGITGLIGGVSGIQGISNKGWGQQ